MLKPSHLYLDHGELAFTLVFCFESMINYIKRKAFGTKNFGSQNIYWCDIASIVLTKEFNLPVRSLRSETKMDYDSFNSYKQLFISRTDGLYQDVNQINLYLRFQNAYVTYHSLIYSEWFSCASHIISYLDNREQVQHANIIIFYLFDDVEYSFVQNYKRLVVKLSDYIDIPENWKEIIDSIYPICSLSDELIIIPVNKILSKCVSVHFQQYQCISERRVNYEHD